MRDFLDLIRRDQNLLKRGSAETRLLDTRSPASPGGKEADTPGCGDNPVPASITEEGTRGIIDGVGFRISHRHCRKCGSDNLEIVWRCEEPMTISYECQETSCGHVTKEEQEIVRP